MCQKDTSVQLQGKFTECNSGVFCVFVGCLGAFSSCHRATAYTCAALEWAEAGSGANHQDEHSIYNCHIDGLKQSVFSAEKLHVAAIQSVNFRTGLDALEW